MVQISQAMLYAFGVELFKQTRNGRVKADLLGRCQRIAQVFELHGHARPRRKVALHHALAVYLQDAAVGKAAGDGFFDFGHVRTATLAQQQGLRYGTNGDANNHLVRQFGQLTGPNGTHMRGAPQMLKDGQGACEVAGIAAGHDGERTLLGT